MNVDIVALESTNQVPLTMEVRQMWADKRQYLGVDFQSYAAVPPLTHFVQHTFMGCINYCLCGFSKFS